MFRLKRISDQLIARAAEFRQVRKFTELLGAERVIVLLKGARGIGKTTALLQHLHTKQSQGLKCLFVSADSVLVDGLNLFDIAERFADEGGQVLALDEVHKKDGWDQSLKSIFDSFPNLKVIASGSSSLQITKADLSRRALSINCYGLSFCEWLNIRYDLRLNTVTLGEILNHHEDISQTVIEALRPIKVGVIEAFKSYLREGYFPTSLELESWVYQETIRESVRKTIEQDILACYPELSGRSIQRLKKCLAIMAEKCPYTPDINDLTAALDLSDQKTTKQYLFYLHEARLIREVAKAGKTISALAKAEKIYLDNTNYLYSLCRDDPDQGTVRETFMANVLGIYSEMHQLSELQVPKKGDFLTADGHLFEVGGRSKTLNQLAGAKMGWVAADDLEFGQDRKVPLWIFGFLW